MSESWVTHRVEVRGEVALLRQREWLLTNGAGGYAMGTLPGVNTRRYHGLLIAARRPPVDRVVVLNQVLEQLVLRKGGQSQTVEFSSLLFRKDGEAGDGDTVTAPAGLSLLRQFERGLDVAWTYRWGGVELTRRLGLHWKRQSATVSYTIRGLDAGAGQARLRLAPMLTLRDFHALRREGDAGQWSVLHAGAHDRVTVGHGEVSATFVCAGATFVSRAEWWRRVHYPIDAQRGQEDREDHYLPGWFEVDLASGAERTVSLTVSLGEHPVDAPPAHADRLPHLRTMIAAPALARQPEDLRKMLALAADDFVVTRTPPGAGPSQKPLATILAGYPWFADWGRDTFISLPGLLLETQRFEEASAVLRAFAGAIRDGLVPNRFDDYDASSAHYNTVDASLWFIHAALRYVQLSGDRSAWDMWLGRACRDIIEAYLRGAPHNIRMAGDGLITAGSADTQLTWMDAACAAPGQSRPTIFTPRHGKAVEINALWYSALAGMAEQLADSDKPAAAHYTKLLGRIRRSFGKVFWNERAGCLVDHVWTDAQGVDHADTSIRPNQIFAASLPHSPIPRTRQQQVLDTVERKLLTPFGLRTLPTDDPDYHGRYAGPQFQRDGAYHRGTVWPWLLGPYAQAVLRVGRFSAQARATARAALTPLLETIAGRGPHPALGQLHEIHEADPPHQPVGCMAQAWSVAQLIEALALLDADA